MNSQTFGERIRALRLNMNYTLKFVGQAIGCSPQNLSRIERSQKRAPLSFVQALAKLYQVPYQELHAHYLSECVYDLVHTAQYADQVLNTVQQRIRKARNPYSTPKGKTAIFETIKSYFAQQPVEKAWVFGSFARNAPASLDSDIDLLVAFKQPHTLSLFDLLQMKDDLAQKTGRAIDLVEAGQELDSFKEAIEREKILIYGN